MMIKKILNLLKKPLCNHINYDEDWLVQDIRIRKCKDCGFTDTWGVNDIFENIPRKYTEDSEMQGSTHKHIIYIDGIKKFSYYNKDRFEREKSKLLKKIQKLLYYQKL